MGNLFSIIGIIGVVLFVSGYYFIDNGRYVYFLGIALMVAGFIGIKKTKH
jgi:multidrug transporter EmrE-like cation transporter